MAREAFTATVAAAVTVLYPAPWHAIRAISVAGNVRWKTSVLGAVL